MSCWLKKQIQYLANDLKPIFCIGETLQEREANQHFDIIKSQLVEGVFHLDAAHFSNWFLLMSLFGL
jgi:triosephosphate isomerase